MSMLVPIALFGWIPMVIALFSMLPPRRALFLAFIFGWLFLPNAGYAIQGLPDYTKTSATTLGALLGVCIFDAGTLASFRPRWFDLPMLVWCLCPFASAVSNDLGTYEGVSAVMSQTFTWGIPYLLGRFYLTDTSALRELAVGILLGATVYIPLVVWEARMYPTIHRAVYGLSASRAEFSPGFGSLGWEPRVFMYDELSLTMYMGAASLIGVWFWLNGSLKTLLGIPVTWLVPALLLATLLCKGLGAISLLLAGCAVLILAKRFNTAIPFLCLLLIPPLYIVSRSAGGWSGDAMVWFAGQFSERKISSISDRLNNEEVLMRKALERPIFGWGRYGRSRVKNEEGKDIVRTDGMWIITLGQSGFVGLTAFAIILLLPGTIVLMRVPAALWAHPAVAPGIAVALLLTLYMIDNLFNAMPNPIFMLSCGIVGWYADQCAHQKTPIHSNGSREAAAIAV